MAEKDNDNLIYQVDIVGHTMMGCYDVFQRMKPEASQPNHGGISSRRICKPRDR